MPIPVALIAGYLGSGKTTLINQLLKQANLNRVAILVNDFGDLAIDAELIEAKDDTLISLSGGCVCCSYGNDLSNALLELLSASPPPAQIVIEASGVAIPSAIAASIALIKNLYMHGTLVLVNAEQILEQVQDRYVGDTVVRQLEGADLLIVNKIDLVDREVLTNVSRWMTQAYPDARTVFVEHSVLPAFLIAELSNTGFNNVDVEALHEVTHHAAANPVNKASAVHSENSADTDVIKNTDTRSETASIHAPASQGTGIHSQYQVTHTDMIEQTAIRQKTSEVAHASQFEQFTVLLTKAVDTQALMKILVSEKSRIIRAKGFAEDVDGTIKLLQVVGRRGEILDMPDYSVSDTRFGVVCIGLAGVVSEHSVREAIDSC